MTKHTKALRLFSSWTQESSYVIGYIWADGCVYTENGKPAGIIFRCTESDSDLLEMVKSAIGITRPLNRVAARIGRIGDTEKPVHSKSSVWFRICSAEIARSLVQTHGIPPRKSFVNPKFPTNIPIEMLNHFARGYFDGDGCVSIKSSQKRVAAGWVGTPQFINGLTERVAKAVGIRMPALTPSGCIVDARWTAREDVMRLREWLYRDATIFLARKKDKFDAATAVLENIGHRFRGTMPKSVEELESLFLTHGDRAAVASHLGTCTMTITRLRKKFGLPAMKTGPIKSR